MRRRLSLVLIAVALGLWLGLLLSLLLPGKVRAGPTTLTPISTGLVGDCHHIPVTWYSPTGVAGCEVYGTGVASWWGGPGVAVNSCLYPWTNCTPITIRSLDTGRSITLSASMFCDCFTGTTQERLVDLDPTSLRMLGLWHLRGQGLFPVTVQPATALPDTAMEAP